MASLNDILKRMNQALADFSKNVPAIEDSIFNEVNHEIRRLDLDGSRGIKNTVKNLKILASIRAKIMRLVITDKYKDQVKDFVKAFNDITTLQHEYWRKAEATFKPTPLLREIRKQAIATTVDQLTEAGIGVNIADKITGILKTNITTGGSYKALQDQLRESLTTTKTPGLLSRYISQITTDSIHQYNAQYTQAISSDLGYEWYSYRGTEIKTSREFCQAMVEGRRYFHITEVPALLAAEGMEFKDNYDGKTKPVRINPKTNLPFGFIEGTNEANFFIRRGGYSCGHQIGPVTENQVPLDIRQRVFNTDEYRNWARARGVKINEKRDKVVEKIAAR